MSTSTSCCIAGCENTRCYDGLCLHHLWDAEHFQGYLGAVHEEYVEHCPFCADASLESAFEVHVEEVTT